MYKMSRCFLFLKHRLISFINFYRLISTRRVRGLILNPLLDVDL